jgi:ECF sigma factor.
MQALQDMTNVPGNPDSLDGPPPTDDPIGSVTCLLVDAEEGDEDAWNRIYTLVYHDLHRIARSQIRRHAQPGLTPTSLISETWIKLARTQVSASCRPHLMSLIARAMRFDCWMKPGGS